MGWGPRRAGSAPGGPRVLFPNREPHPRGTPAALASPALDAAAAAPASPKSSPIARCHKACSLWPQVHGPPGIRAEGRYRDRRRTVSTPVCACALPPHGLLWCHGSGGGRSGLGEDGVSEPASHTSGLRAQQPPSRDHTAGAPSWPPPPALRLGLDAASPSQSTDSLSAGLPGASRVQQTPATMVLAPSLA